MGVKVRKRGGKWYVVIDYHGRRKSRCVGTREAAERVKREVEAKLALGDIGMLSKERPTSFKEYAERWLSTHAKVRCKPSMYASYDQILKTHLFPRFGSTPLKDVTRDGVNSYFSGIAASGKYARHAEEHPGHAPCDPWPCRRRWASAEQCGSASWKVLSARRSEAQGGVPD